MVLSMASKRDDVRTTIRLSRQRYDALKRMSLSSGKSAEAIIDECLRLALPSMSFDLGAEHPTQWGPLLAKRFVQFLPSPFVLKEENEAVIYANPAYEDEFKVPLDQLRGRSITDFGLLSFEREQIHKDIQRVVEHGRPTRFIEAVTFSDGKTVPYSSVRYVYELNGTKVLGDFTFPWEMIFAPKAKDGWSTLQIADSILKSPVSSGMQEFFMPALSEAPLSIVIKDASDEMKIVWCNNVFVLLAQKKRPEIKSVEDVVGRTSQYIWSLKDHHPVVVNDIAVMETKTAQYFSERLEPQGQFRTTLRFPILGGGGMVKFIGSVSPNFRVTGISSGV